MGLFLRIEPDTIETDSQETSMNHLIYKLSMVA
jgi:hypothetical protein